MNVQEDVLDAELSTRVSEQDKKEFRKIAISRHLTISDIFREAIREKIQRSGLEADVSDIGDEPKERASITLDPDLFEKGKERARKARRNFSNYVEVLIDADVGEHLAAQPKSKVYYNSQEEDAHISLPDGDRSEAVKTDPVYTAVKMDRELYDLARERAQSRHQTYSAYVRQLIARDSEQKGDQPMSTISELERTATKILADLRRLEQIPLRSAAKMLHKSPDWVRANLPVVILGPKSHRIRTTDIEAFLAKRTVWPQLNGKKEL